MFTVDIFSEDLLAQVLDCFSWRFGPLRVDKELSVEISEGSEDFYRAVNT